MLMVPEPKSVALFGRFTLLPRAHVVRLLNSAGATETKGLTRGTDLMAIGAGAANFMSGALPRRLAEARSRDVPVVSEAALLEMLRGEARDEGQIDLSVIAPGATELVDRLNAFDLIRLSDGKIRFQDADTVRTAMALAGDGADPAQIVSALVQRRRAPKGRHRLSLDASGDPVLVWEDGVTEVTGQGYLPLEEGDSLEDLFEEARGAEASGNLSEAARLYGIAARHDRKDPIAPFNLGNVQIAAQEFQDASLAFRAAIARKPDFAEAHYNLAIALEAQGRLPEAIDALEAALKQNKDYPEALFNRAQLELVLEHHTEALAHFERFLNVAKRHALAPSAKRAVTLLRSMAPA